MSKTLVIAGHPNYKNSHANRAILDEFHHLVPEAEIVYLDALYPDAKIDVETEQRRLVEADTIVFEFPFWWYSAPSLMRAYLEQVLTHGFAYGYGTTALHGKKLIISFTTGAAADAYTPEGYQHYDISAFTPPYRALANLCGLTYGGEIISFGMILPDPGDRVATDAFHAKVSDHAQRLANAIK